MPPLNETKDYILDSLKTIKDLIDVVETELRKSITSMLQWSKTRLNYVQQLVWEYLNGQKRTRNKPAFRRTDKGFLKDVLPFIRQTVKEPLEGFTVTQGVTTPVLILVTGLLKLVLQHGRQQQSTPHLLTPRQ